MTVWIAWAALVVALGALGYGWKLSYEVAATRRRLDRYNKALFDANDEIARLRDELAHMRNPAPIQTPNVQVEW